MYFDSRPIIGKVTKLSLKNTFNVVLHVPFGVYLTLVLWTLMVKSKIVNLIHGHLTCVLECENTYDI
jgi:glycopeptide antibiotics resistance protein